MTLVELIIAMVIASIMIGSAAVFLPNYRDMQTLKQSSLDLNDSLRYAQTLALGKQTDDYVSWKIMEKDDEKLICVIDKRNLEEDPECESLGKIFDVSPKISIQSNFTDIYFQGNTGVMYNDTDFDTAAIINGEVRLIHTNRDEVGDTYYGMILASNSFSLNQDSIGEDGGTLEVPTEITGCMDSVAINYNPDATVGSGNCEYADEISGCTSPNAINFDSEANVDDGSCEYAIYGCTDINAVNYDRDATIDDESCEYEDDEIYYIPGCTDQYALNFNIEANVDDGSCIFGFEDGTQCNNDDQCLSGVCEYQYGSGVICMPKLPSGATCDSDEQCESGICEQTKYLWYVFNRCK